MEDKAKLDKVQALLLKPLNKNLGEYKAMYIYIFGRPFKSSCSCQINRIRTELQDWYNKNKV